MQPMMNHIAWVTDDQEGVANFLRTYFDCEIGERRTIEGAWADELAQMKNCKVYYLPAVCQGTATRIAILKFINPEPINNPDVSELNRKGLRHFGFLVEDIAAKVSQLKSGGYEFLSDVVTAEGFESQTVYFRGPENVIVQLTESMMATPPPPHGS